MAIPMKGCLGVIGCLIILILITIGWMIYSVVDSTTPTTDTRHYSKIAAKRNEYGFFPKQIPAEATKVGFLFVPGFSEDELMLRLELPDAKIKQILGNLINDKRQEVGRKDFYQEGMPMPLALPDFGSKLKKSDNLSELPDDFRIFLMNCDLVTIKNNWNHHFMGFTAISTQRGEVVYFAEIS